MKRPIEAVRREIDTLDREMLRLLRKRYALVLEAGRFKLDRDPAVVHDAEQQLLAGVRRHALELGLSPDVAEATFAAMVGGFAALEQADFEKRSRESEAGASR